MSKAKDSITPSQERIGKLFLRWYSKSNVFLYRLTGGKIGGKFPGGAPVCLITMKGRKTGLWRTTPLIHIPNAEGIVLVASQGGMSKNPIWYNNLTAHPQCSLQVGYQKRAMVARQASDEEKEKLWPTICSVHPGFQDYQDKTNRNIPVMVCSPA